MEITKETLFAFEPLPAATSFSRLYSAASWTIASAALPFTYSYSCLEHYCLDGGHLWKQKKYQNTLKQLKRAAASFQAQQLKNRGEPTPLEKKYLELLSLLEELPEDCRSRHREFILKLREVLSGEEFEQEMKKAEEGSCDAALYSLLNLCYAVYHENHLYTFCQSLISKVISLGQAQFSDPEKRELDLKEEHDAIAKAPSSIKAPRAVVLFKNLLGALNAGFDPQTWGNLPYVLFDFSFFKLEGDEKKEVRFLRMPTPTIGSAGGYEADAMPEFVGYLLSAAHRGEKHLYVSMQYQLSGVEAVRTTSLKKLCEHPGLKDSFSLIVLDQDSPFYHQSGPFAEKSSAKEFLQLFFDQMFESEDSNFYFPESMKSRREFRAATASLLSLLHRGLFSKKEQLSREERLDFIELFYPLLILFVLRDRAADTVNITCQDGLDRAGKVIALLVKMLLISTKKNDKKNRERLTTFIHSAPFLAKKQPLQQGRFERLQSAFKRLESPELQSWLVGQAKRLGIDVKEELSIQEIPEQRLPFSDS